MMGLKTMDAVFVLILWHACVCQLKTIGEERNVRPVGPHTCQEYCESLKQCRSPHNMGRFLTCYIWNPNTTLAGQTCSRTIKSRLKGLATIHVTKTNTETELVKDNVGVNLHQACGEGKLDVVKYILSQGVKDINSRGKRRTPVMEAVLKGQLEVFNFLVEQGCDLSLLEENKNSVLHFACYVSCGAGHVDMVKHIISLNVTGIDSKDIEGRTPVMYAVKGGHTSVVDLLVSKHSNMAAVDNDGYTLLHIACEDGNVDMVSYILSLNVIDKDSQDKDGRTPLMLAVEEGHISVVDVLVSTRCNTAAVDDDGYTLLHIACAGGHVDMVKYILSLNVIDKDSKDNDERTPIMVAVVTGTTSVVHLLISKQCNIKAVDNKGNNVIHLACRYRHGALVKYILSLEVLTGKEKNKNGETPAEINII